jgi:release factor glutamine methyltransferase
LAGRARFERRDWAAGLTGIWQAIVSNPPYIVDREIDSLSPEVARYEPRRALAGGPDGLDAYRTLIPQVRRLMAFDGICALEIGDGQAAAVEGIASQNGLKPVGRAQDLGGIDRCVIATPM